MIELYKKYKLKSSGIKCDVIDTVTARGEIYYIIECYSDKVLPNLEIYHEDGENTLYVCTADKLEELTDNVRR